MFRVVFCAIIFFCTLGLGVSASTLCRSILPDSLPLAISEAVPAPAASDRIFRLPDGAPPLKKGDFYIVGHGCGNGYIDAYLAYDGSKMNAGLEPMTPQKFVSYVQTPGIVIIDGESIDIAKAKKGIRLILRGTNDNTGRDIYEVVRFDSKFGMYYVDGPTLAITLELERWINREK